MEALELKSRRIELEPDEPVALLGPSPNLGTEVCGLFVATLVLLRKIVIW